MTKRRSTCQRRASSITLFSPLELSQTRTGKSACPTFWLSPPFPNWTNLTSRQWWPELWKTRHSKCSFSALFNSISHSKSRLWLKCLSYPTKQSKSKFQKWFCRVKSNSTLTSTKIWSLSMRFRQMSRNSSSWVYNTLRRSRRWWVKTKSWSSSSEERKNLSLQKQRSPLPLPKRSDL